MRCAFEMRLGGIRDWKGTSLRSAPQVTRTMGESSWILPDIQ